MAEKRTLAQALCLQKKIDVNTKASMSIHKTQKNMISFGLELKGLTIMSLLQINNMLATLLRIKINSNFNF